MPRFLIFLALVASSVASLGQTTPLAPVTNLTTGEVYLTIQEAVDEAANGEELQLASARFEEHVAFNAPVVLSGDPDGLTIIDVSLEDGWGLTLSSDNITLKDFTVMSGGVNTAYAIHSEPGITGLTIEDVNVLNSSRSCIDLNGLTGPELNVIRNVNVSNSAIGFGLAMSSCASVWIENITSTDNGFGDIAIMESNYYEQNITGVSFNGQLDLGGPQSLGGGGVVVQVPIADVPVGIGPGFAISMNAPGYQYFLEADGEDLTGCILPHNDHIRTIAFALGAEIESLVSCDMTNQEIHVFPGMFVQSAVDAASENEVIKVEAGLADTSVIEVDHSLTLLGANAGISGLTAQDRDVESVLPGITVTAGSPVIDGFRIQPGSGDAVEVMAAADGLTLRNSILLGQDLSGQVGVKSRNTILLNEVKITKFDEALMQNGGQLTVQNSLIKENNIGIKTDHDSGNTGFTDIQDCTFENAGGKAVLLTQGAVADSFAMSNCVLNLHTTAFEKGAESSISMTLTNNTFSNSEGQLAGVERETQLAFCASNSFSPALRITGCTDSSADNFEACATIHQGCQYLGCTSPKACNFDPSANTDDGSCDLISCAGCPLGFACNYDPNADLYKVESCDFSGCEGSGMATGGEDRSGLLLVAGCTIPQGCNYNPDADTEDGSCTFDCYGCMDVAACNYDAVFTLESNETCLFIQDLYPSTYVDCEGVCYNDTNGNGVCDEEEINGCTDGLACNFLSDATLDDGSCDYASCAGCINPAACNHDADAYLSDGSCDYTSCSGCSFSMACNYDSTAFIDDGSCVFPVDLYSKAYVNCEGGCLNDLDGDGICDEEEVGGCTDSEACNFEVEATDDDGSCDYMSCAGCTDEFACNYNPFVTLDDGGCEGPEDLYPDAIVDGVSVLDCLGRCNNDTDEDGVCDELEVTGCTDPLACNYDDGPFTDTDNDLCTYVDGNCDTCEAGALVDRDADNDGVCDDDEIAGCQDEQACNFDPEATDNDDSCIYASGPCESCLDGGVVVNDQDNDGVCDSDEVTGCTDSSACNYNDNPTTDSDNSLCTYTDGLCQTCEDGVVVDNDADGDGICDNDEVNCIGDLNEDGLRGAADILILLAGFGCSSDCGIADLNDDGLVAASDILMALSTFGLACPN